MEVKGHKAKNLCKNQNFFNSNIIWKLVHKTQILAHVIQIFCHFWKIAMTIGPQKLMDLNMPKNGKKLLKSYKFPITVKIYKLPNFGLQNLNLKLILEN